MHASAKTIWSGGLRTSNLIREFELETDQPKIYYGTNTAPAPAEVFTASIGACFVTSFAWYAFHKHLEVDEITVDVRSEIEKTKEEEKITEIKMKVKVWSKPNLEPKLEKCYKYAMSHCPLTTALKIPVKISIKYILKDD
jgi:uncharacterized OsmC-like protein